MFSVDLSKAIHPHKCRNGKLMEIKKKSARPYIVVWPISQIFMIVDSCGIELWQVPDLGEGEPR